MLKAYGLNLRYFIFAPWREDTPIGCPLHLSLMAEGGNRWDWKLNRMNLKASALSATKYRFLHIIYATLISSPFFSPVSYFLYSHSPFREFILFKLVGF